MYFDFPKSHIWTCQVPLGLFIIPLEMGGDCCFVLSTCVVSLEGRGRGCGKEPIGECVVSLDGCCILSTCVILLCLTMRRYLQFSFDGFIADMESKSLAAQANPTLQRLFDCGGLVEYFLNSSSP
jgi:hypothetical protein